MNALIVISVLAVIVFFIYWKFVINEDSDEDEEVHMAPKLASLPDIAYKDPQTGELRMKLEFDESQIDIGEYLFLDIETTGLPKVRDAKPEEFDYMPRVVQISWILLDLSFKCVCDGTHYLKQDAQFLKRLSRFIG